MVRLASVVVALALSSFVAGCSAEVEQASIAPDGDTSEEAVVSASLELQVCTARPEWNGACPSGTEVKPSASKKYALKGKTAFFSVRAAGGQNGRFWPAINPRVFQNQPNRSWYELTSGVSLEALSVTAPSSATSFTYAPVASDRTEARRNPFWPTMYAFAPLQTGTYTLRASAIKVGACNMVVRSGTFALLREATLAGAGLPSDAPKASCPVDESATFVVNVD